MRSAYLTVLALAISGSGAFAHVRPTFNTYERFSGDYQGLSHPNTIAARSEAVLDTRAPKDANPLDVAEKHLKKLAPKTSYKLVGDHYTDKDTGVTHAYFVQTYNGVEIENTQINVNVKDGKVLSAGSSFITGPIKASKLVRREQELDPAEALRGVFQSLGLKGNADNAYAVAEDSLTGGGEAGKFTIVGVEGVLSEPTAVLRYYRTGENEIKQIWRIETDLGDNWLVSYADAEEKGKVHGVTDYVADADSYQVFPLGVNDPSDGSRVTLTSPAKLAFSPNGWHVAGSNSYTTTRGNNGIAQENWDAGSDYLNNQRPNGASGTNRVFSYPYAQPTSLATAKTYINAAVTQLFYTANIFHDLLESLGFTEAAGNFEEVNTGSGGLGGDAVQLNAQDGAGYNNANMATPADGQRPRMRMYLWNTGSPWRDGDFDNGVIIHEYCHGLSNRLTGGPANAACLNTLESGGMGEGWGDFFATTIRIKPGDTRATSYGMGNWVNNGAGIRPYSYSTSMTTNPTTYTTINTSSYQAVHSVGSVWANMLYEVLWNLIDKHGYSAEIFPVMRAGTQIPNSGRSLALKLVLEGMKLQPCRPTFISARNAIIDADEALTGGENFCELWRAFAKRGLGTAASLGSGTNTRVNSFAVPSGC